MSSSNRVLAVYGAGGYGRELLELAELVNETTQQWNEFIFIDDADELAPVIDGYTVFSYVAAKEKYGDRLDAVVAVGEPRIRKILFEKLKADSVNTPVIINPTAFVSKKAKVGAGSVIRYGSSVFTGAEIGENVCINPHANIGHDTKIEEGSIVSMFANIAGGVHVGKYVYIGMSAVIRELVSVGDRSVISMGEIISKDVPSFALAIGTPVKYIKINETFRVFKKAKDSSK